MNQLNPKSIIKWAITAFCVLFILYTINDSFYVNTEYEHSVVTYLGEIDSVTGSGIHSKIPFLESVHTADTRVESYNQVISVATANDQTISVTLTINHRITTDSDKLRKLYKDFGGDFDYESRILNTLAVDRAKSIIGGYRIDKITENREQIRMASLQRIKADAALYGIDIIDVQLSDFQWDERYRQRLGEIADARARAQAAEEQAREAQFLANKEIESARGKSESKKLDADASSHQQRVLGDAEAHRITVTSKANADQIRLEGQAKAEALSAQAKALANAPGLIELTKAEALKNWDGSVPQVTFGSGNTGPIPILNTNDLLPKISK